MDWNELTMAERASLIKTYVKNGIYTLDEMRKHYSSLQTPPSRPYSDGGPIKPPYEQWYKTVPEDRNDTTEYNLRRAYDLASMKQLEEWRKARAEELEAGKKHLNSVYRNPQTGEYEFMKSKNHPTIQYELNWYNSNDPEAVKFRQNYSLDTTGNYYKYVPKKLAYGGGFDGPEKKPFSWKPPETFLSPYYYDASYIQPSDNTRTYLSQNAEEVAKKDLAAKAQKEAAIAAQKRKQELSEPGIRVAQEPSAYQSYYTNPALEGWNKEAANFGYALGAGHDMTLKEVNDWNLNTAQLAGWMAAPEIMTLFQTPYYAATGRPEEAALTAVLGTSGSKIKNAYKNFIFDREINKIFNNTKLPNTVGNPLHNRLKFDNAGINNSELSPYKLTDTEKNHIKNIYREMQLNNIINSIGTDEKLKFAFYEKGKDWADRKPTQASKDIIEQQIKPRLLDDNTRKSLIERDNSYKSEFESSIDDVKNNTNISEWSTRLLNEYNDVYNTRIAGFSKGNENKIVVPLENNFTVIPKQAIEIHELRHQLQRAIPRTPSEEKILKEAYGSVPQPLKKDGTTDDYYDMTKEWETMNTEGRQILLDEVGYRYDNNKTIKDNIDEQNRIIDNLSTSELLKVLNTKGDGYWKSFIESLSYNDLKRLVPKWKEAMKKVGIGTGIGVGIGLNAKNEE